MVDVTLAGDNAIVVGMAAQGLAPKDRRKAIFAGIGIATVLRIVMALLATTLLAIVGLTLAGGILLLWVCWKMVREVVGARKKEHAGAPADHKTMRQALTQIVIADISMSVDNVLAVAGTARDHIWVLVFGLALSVALMGAASTVMARLMSRAPWVVWIGVGIVAYVSLSMIYDGWREVGEHIF